MQPSRSPWSYQSRWCGHSAHVGDSSGPPRTFTTKGSQLWRAQCEKAKVSAREGKSPTIELHPEVASGGSTPVPPQPIEPEVEIEKPKTEVLRFKKNITEKPEMIGSDSTVTIIFTDKNTSTRYSLKNVSLHKLYTCAQPLFSLFKLLAPPAGSGDSSGSASF